jgi:hypothetical protein
MAGHARYTALLDACVLFPLAMVDSLIACHVAHVCRRSCQRSLGSPARSRAFRNAVLFNPLAVIVRTGQAAFSSGWRLDAEWGEVGCSLHPQRLASYLPLVNLKVASRM